MALGCPECGRVLSKTIAKKWKTKACTCWDKKKTKKSGWSVKTTPRPINLGRGC